VRKELFWIVSGQAISLVGNLLLLKILTTHLSMDVYGFYTLWMACFLFIRQALYDPFSMVAAKEVIHKRVVSHGGAEIFSAIEYANKRFFVFLFVLVLLAAIVEGALHQDLYIVLYGLAGGGYILANGAHGVIVNVLNALRDRQAAAWGVAIDAGSKILLVALFISYVDDDLSAVLVLIAASTIASFLFFRRIAANRFARSAMESRQPKFVFSQIMLMSLPLVVPTIVAALRGLTDKIFVMSFVGPAELAAYNVLLQIGFLPVVLLIGVLQTYSGPTVYALTARTGVDGGEAFLYVRSLIVKLIGFASFAVVMAHVFGDLLFNVFVGNEYRNYSVWLPLFVAAGTMAGVYGILTVAVIGVFDTRHSGALVMASTLVGISIQAVATFSFGFDGAVVGLIASGLVMSIILGGALWCSYQKSVSS
jgi:O-antigen/teichoic acid export membrane protein